MKTITTLLIASLLSSTASASFYQVTCSSADSLTRSANGHVQNFTIVTELTYENGTRVETPVELNHTNHKVSTLESTDLHSEGNSSCDSKTGAGYSSWKQTIFKRVKITRTDGSLFSENTAGVSQDRTTVEANMICEDEGNSMLFCEE